MRVLAPLAWEGAGGIKGSTFSQNSSLTFHGFVRAISRRLLGAANSSVSQPLPYQLCRFSDKDLALGNPYL